MIWWKETLLLTHFAGHTQARTPRTTDNLTTCASIRSCPLMMLGAAKHLRNLPNNHILSTLNLVLEKLKFLQPNSINAGQ